MGVDEPGDALEIVRRHPHRGEGERAAERLGVDHRPEAGEQPVVDQPLQPPTHLRLRDPQLGGDGGERALDDLDALLQPVHQHPVELIHGQPARATRPSPPSA
jgi:hypothetical protein